MAQRILESVQCSCRGAVRARKILYQEKDSQIEPVADDLASL